MRRIFGIILLLAGVALGIFWYVQRARTRALNSGDVFVREEPGETAKPLPPSPVATAPATPAPTPPATPVPTALVASPHAAPATAAPAPAAQPQHTAQSQHTPATVPAWDSLPRNPPNGMLYAGRGKYQLYRQGDITWRLNTDTGWACVLLATDAQWSKPRVYQEGCRTSGDRSPARGN